MKQILFFLLVWLACFSAANSQSLEMMLGSQRIFVDAQWLKTFDQERKWSLFSRSRATVDYEESTDLFTGAYINYTTNSGFGGTLVGRISTFGAGGDGGIHFFRANQSFLVYALGSLELQSTIGYSWFSILRWTPVLNDRWKLFSGLELFSNFDKTGHQFSVQRLRLGFDREGYQFGLALNLSGAGNSYTNSDSNPGVFLRKQF